MKNAKKMGVIGGMGPLATMDFATKVILLTPATRDQDHIPMIIDNKTTIFDRSNYILNGTNSPLPALIESARFLEKSGADFLVMPCNTAHYFYEEIKKEVRIPFLHIIEETVNEVLSHRSEISKVCLLATKGTYSSRLYETFFEKEEMELLLPGEDEKQLIMDMLYAIKSGTPMDSSEFENLLTTFTERGCNHFILGCTESPLLFEQYGLSYPVFDSSLILAQRSVDFALAESL